MLIVSVVADHYQPYAVLQEFHAYITNGGKPKECCYDLKGVGFLPCGW